MGLWDWCRDRWDDVKDFVSDKVGKVKEKVEEVVENIADFFRHKDPYNDGDMDSRIDYGKVFVEFNDMIQEQAKNIEEIKIEEATKEFDKIIELLETTYPEIIEVLKKKKEEVISNIQGAISEDVRIYASENNSKIFGVLKMSGGLLKGLKTSQEMKRILDNAEQKFDKKLAKQMGKLYDELEEKLKGELEKKKDLLQKETIIYEELQKQVSEGKVDLEKYQALYRYSAEAEDCIKVLFEKGN